MNSFYALEEYNYGKGSGDRLGPWPLADPEGGGKDVPPPPKGGERKKGIERSERGGVQSPRLSFSL